MFKKIVALGGALVMGWYVFFTVSNVDTADIVVYNKLGKHLGSAPFKAGDLVAISPDGLRHSFLCSMNVGADVLREAELSKSYVNGLRQALPAFAATMSWAKGWTGYGSTEDTGIAVTPTQIDFVGRVSSIPLENQPLLSNSCTCAATAAMIRRNRVCVVQKSMIETILVRNDKFGDIPGWRRHERTIGATFRDYNLFIRDISVLQCPQISKNANVPKQTASCTDGNTRDFDVSLRQKLGVIRELALN